MGHTGASVDPLAAELPCQDWQSHLFPRTRMERRKFEEETHGVKNYVRMAYDAPSDLTRPRWRKRGKRWIRSLPSDLPGPFFDLGVAMLLLAFCLVSLFI